MSQSSSCSVAIVGAGPYGLSLAAHLEALGVEYRVFGRPMELWRSHTPKGMMLKSDGFASNLSAPAGGATLKDYCSKRHIPYADRDFPVPVGDFVDYADWFRGRFVAHHDARMVADIARGDDDYTLTLEDGETVRAQQVVLAVGITWFPRLPEEFAGVSPALVSHSYDHRTVDQFAGRKVIVLGGGASAVNLAYELTQVNSDVRLMVRSGAVAYHQGGAGGKIPLRQRLAQPASAVGPGWKSWFCCAFPGLFYFLSEKLRRRSLRRHLKPAGGWYMRDRVQEKVGVVQGRIARVEARADGLALHLADGGAVAADHVICATGYAMELKRLPFLSPAIAAAIARPGYDCFVGHDFQTALPGLYAVGPLAMENFGPLLRFMAGAEYACPKLAQTLARRTMLRRWKDRVTGAVRAMKPLGKPVTA